MPPSRRFLFLIAVLLAAAVPAWAQGTGGIAGVVRDESGAAVPGATVTVTDGRGAIARVVTTGADGSFTVPNLPVGAYSVAAELKGFGRAAQVVRLSAGANMKADLTLVAKLEEAVTVTGTRVRGRTSTDTLAPVDVIDQEAIRSTGATETGKILQLLEPSFNFSTTTISDGTDIIRPATLRSLGPDQVLVLVNGKRYHQQSLLNVQQTIARGSAGYDINSIPASAIDRIEVLRDGAAAQYGSDAIAGVINVILKKQPRATDVTLEAGQFYASNPELPLGASPDARTGHGRNLLGAISTGFAVGRGVVNVSGEYRDRGETNRAGPDSLRVSPPRVVQRIGDPRAKDALLWINADLPTDNGGFYAFGGYSRRKGNSSGFFRSAGDGRTVPEIYPNGFLPTIITQPTDVSAFAGYRGLVRGSWSWDLSANYGKSRFKFREENTVNVSYFYEPQQRNNPNGPKFLESPTEADTGTLGYDQLGANLDFAGVVQWGLGAGPLNVAAGAEWRREGYLIEAGEPVSYQYGRTNDPTIRILDQTGAVAAIGTQGFPGYSPREAVDESRNNQALYVDLESLLGRKFLAGAAARFEHYSDFGSTLTGKLSGRFNVNERVSVRGTVSTGFRAPGVQQQFYNSRSTNLNAAGVLTDTLTARQDSDVTRAFGIPALQEETSKNFSLGLVSKPTDRFRLTVDLYRIDIDDRIIFSSNIQPESGDCGTPFNASRCPIRAILDPFRVGQVQFFTNAVDTKTQGLDIVALYDTEVADGVLSFEAALDFNKTEVKDRKSSSAILPPAVLFDEAQVTLVEEGQPRQRHGIGATYRRNGWRGNLRFNYFGKVAGEGFTPGFKQEWGGKWLTDASLTVPLRKDQLTLTVGGLNIFDVYPDDWDAARASPFPQLGFVYGWETLPFGINGGYYYARLNYRLQR
jgi:iron complex outermembrane receptor protein